MRPIDADELIEDLLYDVELDDRALDSTDEVGLSRVMCQIERGCKQEMVDMLKQAPTIEQPQWIPCSEKLPTDNDYDESFIVTIQCEHVDGWDDYVTGYADFTPHGWDIQSYYLGQIKVVAWMPLPEPYQAERREDG